MKEHDAFEIAYNNGRAAGLAEKEGLLNEEESRDFLSEILKTELLTWLSVSKASELLKTFVPTIASIVASKMVVRGARVLKKI